MVFKNKQQTEFRFRLYEKLLQCLLFVLTNLQHTCSQKTVCYLHGVKIQLEEYISCNVYLKD